MTLEGDDREHRGQPSGANRHRLASAQPLRPAHEVRRIDPRLLGIAAPLRLANPPAGQGDGVAWRELGRCRALDGSGEIDAGNVRISPHQPPDALQDHPVLVIEGRTFDSDGDLARRQPLLIDRLDARNDFAAFLVQYQRAEARHAQARSGSRMLTKFATAAPPIFMTPASEAPGTWMPPALPVTCIAASTCIDTPVAPIGCPFDLSPPDGLTGNLPTFSVQPSRIARAPSPFGVRPIASYSISSAIVKQSWVSTRSRSSRPRRAVASAFFQASAGPSKAMTSRRLIGRKSLTCSAARKITAFLRLSAVAVSASTTAAAPSETSEQSVRFNGPATIGFLSDTVRQNS